MPEQPKVITYEDTQHAWEEYAQVTAERGSIKEQAAWDKYMSVLRAWRAQRP